MSDCLAKQSVRSVERNQTRSPHHGGSKFVSSNRCVLHFWMAMDSVARESSSSAVPKVIFARVLRRVVQQSSKMTISQNGSSSVEWNIVRSPHQIDLKFVTLRSWRVREKELAREISSIVPKTSDKISSKCRARWSRRTEVVRRTEWSIRCIIWQLGADEPLRTSDPLKEQSVSTERSLLFEIQTR